MATIARCVASIAFLAIVLTPLAYAFRCNFHICPQKNGFNCPRRKEGIELSCIVEALHGIHRRKYGEVENALFANSNNENEVNDNDNTPRREATIRLAGNGREATLISRTVPIWSNFSVTVWEWKHTANVVNEYWEAHASDLDLDLDLDSDSDDSDDSPKSKTLLDPFGLVSWPGSVLAAREMCDHSRDAVYNRTVVVLGAGVGVEAQAAAMLGAREVIATDIHPTTLQQLEFGVSRNEQLSSSSDTIVRTEILDLFRTREEQPIPSPCDLLVVADVLYNEELATQVCRRCAEALEENSGIRILVTDSQRFVPGFLDELNQALGQVSSSSVKSLATWKVETMKSFEGSGVIIDEDQTYDVTVQSLWVGL